MKLRRRRFGVVVCVTLAVLALALGADWRRRARIGGMFGSHFKASSVFEWYEMEHGGAFPPTWDALADSVGDDVTANSNRYVFISWPGGRKDTPGWYPLGYEVSSKCNGGLGIYVAHVNQDIRFDFRRRWLSHFLAKHPECLQFQSRTTGSSTEK